MATGLEILGSTTWDDAQRGVDKEETGISIRRWAVRYYPEINEKLPNKDGQTIARAVATAPSREVTLEGEVTAPDTGVMNLAFAAFISIGAQGRIHNDLQWGTTTNPGGLILDEVTETQERAGWRSINMRLSSDPLCVP
jgi:hypothetical protein